MESGKGPVRQETGVFHERLRELRLFSLEQRSLGVELTSVYEYLMKEVKTTKPESSQWCPVKVQEAMGTKINM